MNKFAVGFCLVLLAGCYSRSPIPGASTTQQVTQTPSATETRIPATKTPTPTVTLPPTFTLTPSPTWTPLPALSEEKSLLDYISITANNNCKLPCWAGMTPGETTWSEAPFFSAPLLSLMTTSSVMPENVTTSLYYYGDEIMIDTFVGAKALEQRDKIDWIRLSMQSFTMPTENTPSQSLPLPETFRMKRVLQEYGMPDMVFLSTDIGGPGFPKTYFSTLMVYTDERSIVKYYRDATVKDGVLITCTPSHAITLVVVSEREKLISVDAINNLATQNFRVDLSTPFDKVMDIPLDEFYQEYLSSSSNCFYIPLEAWGYGKSWE